jgi:hypothetical protein
MDRSSAVAYYLGLDLGQASDYSALAILETADAAPPRTYHARHLQRWALQTPYTEIAQETAELAEAMGLAWRGVDVWLAFDLTGVGRPVWDLLKREPMPHVQLVPIVITGGDTEGRDGSVWHVPKRNLVGVTQVALQTGRLKIASALPEATTLTRELQNFQMKITATTGHDTYGAWREGTHDDVLLAVACALWVGERRGLRWVPVGR